MPRPASNARAWLHESTASDEDREVLFLYAFAEFTYSEVAQACDIPIGTVRSRLSRTRGILYGPLLEAEGGGEPVS